MACEQVEIGRQLGWAEAGRVFEMSVGALDLIRTRCAGFGSDGDWRDGSLGVATSADKARARPAGADPPGPSLALEGRSGMYVFTG